MTAFKKSVMRQTPVGTIHDMKIHLLGPGFAAEVRGVEFAADGPCSMH
jgi:hypothetical protein